mgnify:CR=1 FL=1
MAPAEAARADAEIKAGKYRGPLHGIPYGVKDIFSTRGVPTTWGAADFENRIIDEDAEVAVRLRDAGAVLIAKLATGLFATVAANASGANGLLYGNPTQFFDQFAGVAAVWVRAAAVHQAHASHSCNTRHCLL